MKKQWGKEKKTWGAWTTNKVCGFSRFKFQSSQTVLQMAAFPCKAIYGHMVSAKQNKLKTFTKKLAKGRDVCEEHIVKW